MNFCYHCFIGWFYQGEQKVSYNLIVQCKSQLFIWRSSNQCTILPKYNTWVNDTIELKSSKFTLKQKFSKIMHIIELRCIIMRSHSFLLCWVVEIENNRNIKKTLLKPKWWIRLWKSFRSPRFFIIQNIHIFLWMFTF